MCRVCFHIHLLKVESFPVLIENLILRGLLASMICDITTSLEDNPGQLWSSVQHKCDVETWVIQCINTENELGNEVNQETSCV